MISDQVLIHKLAHNTSDFKSCSRATARPSSCSLSNISLAHPPHVWWLTLSFSPSMHLTDGRKPPSSKAILGRIFMLISWQEKNKIPKRSISSVLLIVFKVGFEWAVLLFPLYKLKSSQVDLRYHVNTISAVHKQISYSPGCVSVIRSVGLSRPQSSASLNRRPWSSGGDGWSARCGWGRRSCTKWRRSSTDRRMDAVQQGWWLCIGLIQLSKALHLPVGLRSSPHLWTMLWVVTERMRSRMWAVKGEEAEEEVWLPCPGSCP